MAENTSLNQYSRSSVPTPGNASNNEAWALIEAARQIAALFRFGYLNSQKDTQRLRAALRLNLRVWTIVQAEQTAGESLLPEEIRLNILTLCKFIDNQTVDCMINPTAEKAVALININRNIAAGLMGSISDDTEPVETAEQTAQEDTQKSGIGDGVGIKI